MRTIHRLIEAKKAEREENGEAGFSLIELIIVVVILGILVAIAIPIFGNIQAEAQKNAVKTAAANSATAVAAALAQTPAGNAVTARDSASKDGITFAWKAAAPTRVDQICVVATAPTGWALATAEAGPGC